MTVQPYDDAPIQAFTDDSITDELVAAAALVVARPRIDEVIGALAEGKRFVEVDSDVPIHCRVLFHRDARRGTPWEGIRPEKIWEMLTRLCTNLTKVTERPHVAVIRREQMPTIPGGFEVPDIDAHQKAIASMAYMVVSNGVVRQFHPASPRIWMDPDSTRIPWMSGKHRADRRPDRGGLVN